MCFQHVQGGAPAGRGPKIFLPFCHCLRHQTVLGLRVGPALAEPESRDFAYHVIHASHAVPCAPNRVPSPLVSGGRRRDAYRVTFHALQPVPAPLKAQEGPTAVRVQTQQCASACTSPRRRDARFLASWQRIDRPGTSSGRSRGTRATKTGGRSFSDHLRRHAGRWMVHLG